MFAGKLSPAFVLLGLVAATFASATPATSPAMASPTVASPAAVAAHVPPRLVVANAAHVGLPPEVRIRKLHLVRPDLIQYPISYEIYC